MSPKAKQMRYTALQLLNLALEDPAAVPELDPSDLDWLIRLARRARLHGRLAADLKRYGVIQRLPRTAKDQLESALAMADARKRVALWELDRIQWATQAQQSVPLICLKGTAYVLFGLPNVPGRIFADVDLLIPEARLEEIEATLNAAGWRTQQLTPYDDNYYRKWTHEIPPLMHVERDVEIDLHHNILPRTARLKPSSAKLVERAVEVTGTRYSVLQDTDIVLHAMTHLMFDSDLEDKLRDLVDVSDLLTHFAGKDDGFWDRLLERAEELCLERPAYYSLRYASRILNKSIPADIESRASAWAPMAAVLLIMDRLVPAAILPPHPERPTPYVRFCRMLLYMRSHWIRMPPWLLSYHLAIKFVRRRLGGGDHAAD